MFKGAFTLVTISGVPVRIHWTFFLLLAWAFGTSAFGRGAGGAGGAVNINAGLLSLAFVAALFACVVAHEFGHILAARSFGIRTRDVTLLPIGGVAALERLPEKPWQELVVALAGPLVNVVIALALVPGLLLSFDFQSLQSIPQPGNTARGFAVALAAVNVWLLLFNLIPAFPMDGGRVLRALLAMVTDRVRATNIAARIGQLLAVGMAAFGLLNGRPMLLVLAAFIFFGAGAEAAGVRIRERLRGLRIADAMLRSFRVLSESLPLGAAATELLASPQFDVPVTRDGTTHAPIVGILTGADLAKALAERGPDATVRDVMRAPRPSMRPDDSAWQAAAEFQRGDCPLVPVVDNDTLVGIVTPESLSAAINARTAGDRGPAPKSVHSPR